ncbi:MAG: glycosyltransferase family 2 protein, partial [Prevotella sp.]
MKLSVIIVNYNVKFYLEQCLRSVRKALEGIDAEVIVIDNHSRDGSVEYLSARFPDYTFISSNHNLGFARANNRAIEQSRGEYILLLNPDTVVSETSLHVVLDFMDGHPRAGAAGVRMIKVDGSDALESRRGVPSPMTSFYKMSGLCRHFPQSRRFGKYYMSYLSWTEPAQIEIVSGAFCMLRRKALDEVGLLDEDYFMYGEDIDLSYRLLKGGWENWYVPVKILHYKGESTQKSSFRYVHVFYEAMLIFFRKHFGHLSFLLTCPVQLAIYAKAFLALLSMVLGKMRRSLGFVDSPFKSDPLYV